MLRILYVYCSFTNKNLIGILEQDVAKEKFINLTTAEYYFFITMYYRLQKRNIYSQGK